MSSTFDTVIPIVVGTTEGASVAFAFGGLVRGILLIPAGVTAGNLTFYTSDTRDGTYYLVKDEEANTTVLRAITADQAKPLPPEVESAHYLKVVTSAGPGVSAWTVIAKGN